MTGNPHHMPRTCTGFKRNPSDWAVWIEYAVSLASVGDNRRASQALAYALRTGGNEARQALARLPAEMAEAVRPLLMQRQGPGGQSK